MNPFPPTPPPTDRDRKRLMPHLGNEHDVRPWAKTARGPDLRRAVVIELERKVIRKAVVKILLVAIKRDTLERILKRKP